VALRVELIQMLLAEHPSGCLFCPEKDHCDECMVTCAKRRNHGLRFVPER
jgi:hypothetical protein